VALRRQRQAFVRLRLAAGRAGYLRIRTDPAREAVPGDAGRGLEGPRPGQLADADPTYSADDETETAELLARVPREVALEWAQRVKPETTAQALQPARVGAFDALFFESSVPSRLGYDLHWRHWVFMHGNHCYFIVSTLPPDKESELLPDVQAMLASFRINTP
jgi:hypothetical protein